jgi:hypothetical protein
MSVSDPGEKIEWGADSEPRKNERVPSSVIWIREYAHAGRKVGLGEKAVLRIRDVYLGS